MTNNPENYSLRKHRNSMKSKLHNILLLGLLTGGISARAEIETTGVPGSPSATTTISGKQLPAPDPKFGGVIKDGALQSKAWWAPRIVPPKGAPNVLLIITDDSGFRRAEHLRRRHPDAGDGSRRQDRSALQ